MPPIIAEQLVRLYGDGDDGTGNFATHPPQIFSFVPMAANDWCGGTYGSGCLVVNLNDFAGKKNVKIAFETVSGLSNNIYIDDVWIDSPDGIAEAVTDNKIRIFPNPSGGNYTLQSLDDVTINSLNVYSSYGQLIKNLTSQNLKSGEKLIIDLESKASGIYFLKYCIDGNNRVVKLILNKN